MLEPILCLCSPIVDLDVHKLSFYISGINPMFFQDFSAFALVRFVSPGIKLQDCLERCVDWKAVLEISVNGYIITLLYAVPQSPQSLPPTTESKWNSPSCQITYHKLIYFLVVSVE